MPPARTHRHNSIVDAANVKVTSEAAVNANKPHPSSTNRDENLYFRVGPPKKSHGICRLMRSFFCVTPASSLFAVYPPFRVAGGE